MRTKITFIAAKYSPIVNEQKYRMPKIIYFSYLPR